MAEDPIHDVPVGLEPVLQDLQIAFYDLEPDWQPEHFEEIQRRLSADDGEKS